MISENPCDSNIVTDHVQAAEMQNQPEVAVNSIELFSTRYIFTATQLVQMVRMEFLLLSPVAVYNIT